MGSYKPAPPQGVNPPPMAHAPTFGSAQVALTGIEARQRALAEEGMGANNTIKTSPMGVTEPTTKSPSTLLGG